MVTSKLYPDVEKSLFTLSGTPIHASAEIDPSAKLGFGVTVGAGAKIGKDTHIGAHSVIGPGVSIGERCFIGAHVTLSHALIGNDVTLFPGVRIGQAGFGFHMDEKGHLTIPQLGRVVIEDRVEIGSNTTIDRGTLEDTVIGQGSRIDNLVQIAHGVQFGRHCVVVAQVGISGSTRLEDYVILAGQAGLVGHITIGKGARVAAQAGVLRDVLPGEVVGGTPAVPVKQWHRQTLALAKLTKKNIKSS